MIELNLWTYLNICVKNYENEQNKIINNYMNNVNKTWTFEILIKFDFDFPIDPISQLVAIDGRFQDNSISDWRKQWKDG